MFSFEFSNKKTTFKETSPFPILLADVKAKSFYFTENPDDDSQDDFIQNFLIPNIVANWERSTKYLLLDQAISAFVPSLRSINCLELQIDLTNLNIRSVVGVFYYPEDWNESDAKTELNSDYYSVSEELSRIPSSFSLKKDYAPLVLFPKQNNLEVRYLAGFAANSFTDLDQEIKDALAMQASMVMDTKNGYCEDYYSAIIKDIYAKYTIVKPQISFI